MNYQNEIEKLGLELGCTHDEIEEIVKIIDSLSTPTNLGVIFKTITTYLKVRESYSRLTLDNEMEILEKTLHEYRDKKLKEVELIDDHVESYVTKAQQLEVQALLALQNANNQIQQQADESLRNTVKAIAYPPPLPKLETLKNIPGMVDIYYKWHPEERPKFPIWKYSLAGLAVLVALTQWGMVQKTFFPTMADLQESGHITYDDSPDWQRPDPAIEDTYRKPIKDPYSLRYDNPR